MRTALANNCLRFGLARAGEAQLASASSDPDWLDGGRASHGLKPPCGLFELGLRLANPGFQVVPELVSRQLDLLPGFAA